MKKIAAIFLLGVMISSCTSDIIKPKPVEVPDVVSFSANVIPIFDASCNASGCHANGGIPPNLTPASAYTSLTFFGYVDVDFPEQSILYEKINTGSMAKYATNQDREIILKWIQQGALDN